MEIKKKMKVSRLNKCDSNNEIFFKSIESTKVNWYYMEQTKYFGSKWTKFEIEKLYI